MFILVTGANGKKKISKEFDLKIIFWRDSLKSCMKNLSTVPFLNKE
jgi:hypothetical protein